MRWATLIAIGSGALSAVTADAQTISNINPGSNLLAPGSTTVALSFNTAQAATCRYSLGAAQTYATMQPFDTGQPATTHSGTISGLSSSPAVVNNVYLRCDSDPYGLTTLQYRSVASPTGSFPRIGSIWWGSYVEATQPSQAAKIQLFLSPAFSAEQARAVRTANPNALMLTNVNAMESTSYTSPPNVPEAYFLHDTTGKKIPNWPSPGDYLLNLTKPEVADFLANYAYQVLIQSGLMYDGIFFDNFTTAISWYKADYQGNPVQIDADNDGQPDDPATLDSEWSAGVYRLVATLHQLAPYALVSGHVGGITTTQPQALSGFNGNSFNGDVVQIREGAQPFETLWQTLGVWFSQGRQPSITMVQSSPPLQVAYGYGYFGTQGAPSGVQTFGQTFYPNMRFGLGVALMTDGFSTYDFGDTSSSVNWWYDEYDFNLGFPVGPAARIASSQPPPAANLLVNGSFESGSLSPWHTFYGDGGNASMTLDNAVAADGNSSARVTVTSTSMHAWEITFEQDNLQLAKGVTYQLQFWARSDSPRTVQMICQGGAPNYTNYGSLSPVALGAGWRLYTATFTSTATASDGRLEFWLGDQTGTVWIDGVQVTPFETVDLFRRDFTNGVVLLNATATPQTVSLEAGLKRFQGTQAPRYQYIVDDSDAAFSTSGSWSAATVNSGLLPGIAGGTAGSAANPPYYHAWKLGVHQSSDANGSASWNLQIPQDGVYTLQVWLPAAPNASTWTNAAVYEVVSGGQTIASVTIDQSSAKAGDGPHTLGAWNLTASGAPVLRVHNSGTGLLIADAVYVTSAALYNDGSPASQLTLAPFDAILLQRQTPVPAPTSRVNSVVNAANYDLTIASGGFVSIIGAGFANTSRSWASADFSGGNLPTSLAGVSVTIDGKPAYVEYVSPTQINAIAPDNGTIGQVPVQVTTPQGPSYPGTAMKLRLSPAFFTYQSGTTTYVAAVHLDGTLVGPAGPSSRPATPGEVIEMYGTGFGPTTPGSPSAQLVAQPAPLSLPATVTIGGANAQVQWAGLVSSGLYQLNVQIPNVPAGDAPVQTNVGGFQGAAVAFLSVAGN